MRRPDEGDVRRRCATVAALDGRQRRPGAFWFLADRAHDGHYWLKTCKKRKRDFSKIFEKTFDFVSTDIIIHNVYCCSLLNVNFYYYSFIILCNFVNGNTCKVYKIHIYVFVTNFSYYFSMYFCQRSSLSLASFLCA